MAPHTHFTAIHVHAGLHRVTMGLRNSAASIQKIKVDLSKVPDWTRRAARLSIAVMFFGILGHCARFPTEYQTFASNFRQSCNWAAITCIVVTAPLIGKVAQVAFDRLLGTAVGGFIGCVCFTLGFRLFGVLGGGIFISLMSGATIWATTYLAFRYSLDQLVRFVQLTYIIVAFGAKPDKGAFLLALLRVGGIFAGGLLSVLLAVVVLPRSASIDCLLEMKKALKALYDLNQEVWALSGVTGQNVARRLTRKPHRHGYSALQLRLDAVARGGGSVPILPANGSDAASFTDAAAAAAAMHPSASDPALCTRAQQQQQPDLRPGGAGGSGSVDSLTSLQGSGGGGGLRKGLSDSSTNHLGLLVQHDEERDSREAAVEKLFTAVYTALGRVDEHLAQTRGEIYIWHFWGRYFFLPGVHWFPVRGRWQVPKKDLENMATCVRRVARMLWTLLLDFEEGFGSEMEAVLRLYYPKQLLSELADYQARAILDLLRAFPGATTIEVDNLFTLGQVTDCLMQISDARARNAVFNMKRRRAGATANTNTNTTNNNNNINSVTANAATTAAAAAAGVYGTPQRTANTAKAAERRLSLEMRVSRLQKQADGALTSTTPVAADLEKQPLLAAMAPSSSFLAPTAPAPVTVNGRGGGGGCGSGGGGGGSPVQLLLPKAGSGSGRSGQRTSFGTAAAATTATALSGMPSAGSVTNAAGNGSAGAIAPGGGSSGLFISRLMSGAPGEPLALHLPPRRYMQVLVQVQQQQQQQQQRAQAQQQRQSERQAFETVEKEAAPASAAAHVAALQQESVDIFGGLQFDALVSFHADDAPTDAGAGAGAGVAPTAAVASGTAMAAASPAPLPPRPRTSSQAVGTGVAAPVALPPLTAQLSPLSLPLPLPAAARGSLHATPFNTYAAAAPVLLEQHPSGPVASSVATATTAAAAAADEVTANRPTDPQEPPVAAITATADTAVVAAAAAAPAALRSPACTDSPQTLPACLPPTPASPSPSPTRKAGPSAAVAAAIAAVEVVAGAAAPAAGVASASGSTRPRGSFDAYQSGKDLGLGLDPDRGDFCRLSSMLSSMLVEPVTFPPTEEGYLSQVRWYSFQFVMDEMVNELEEAFHACSAVLQKLPYPIGN